MIFFDLIAGVGRGFAAAGYAHAIPSRLLCGVEASVGGAHQLVAGIAVLRETCYSGANGHRTRYSRELPFIHQPAQFFRNADCVLGVGLRKDDGEFLATITADHVDLPNMLVEDGRHLAENFVAKQVSELVIQTFELIDVDHKDRHPRFKPPRPLDLLQDAHLEVAAVKNPGQPIQVGKLLHAIDVVSVLDSGSANVGH